MKGVWEGREIGFGWVLVHRWIVDSNLQPNCSPCGAQLPCGNQVGCLIVPIIVTDEPKEEGEGEVGAGRDRKKGRRKRGTGVKLEFVWKMQ